MAGPPADPGAFDAALAEACLSLATQMAHDAEGHTKVVRIEVTGAASDAEADVAARKLAGSLLVKCSFYGSDPYWGRVLSDLGTAGVVLDDGLVRRARARGLERGQTLSTVVNDALRVLLREDGSAAIIEPLAADGTDIDLVAEAYTIKAITLGARPVPVSEVHGISQSGSALIAAPQTDYAQAEYGLGELVMMRDAASTTGNAASATALEHLRQRTLDRRTGALLLQPLVHLEIFDVLEFGDALIHPDDRQSRVMAIAWLYDRRAERFEQTVDLGVL